MVSVYLEAVVDNKKVEEEEWSVCGQFAVVISHPDDPKHFFTNSKVYYIFNEVYNLN